MFGTDNSFCDYSWGCRYDNLGCATVSWLEEEGGKVEVEGVGEAGEEEERGGEGGERGEEKGVARPVFVVGEAR